MRLLIGSLSVLILLAACQAAAPPAEGTDAAATPPASPEPAEPVLPAGDPPADPLTDADPRPPELRIMTAGWQTDWSQRTINLREVISGGPPRDGIPSIDEPVFVSLEEADALYDVREPVMALELEGEARAYPLQILIWHEIVNDVIADVPVAVTFCPLCNSALVFDSRVNGEVYQFGVSGLLRNSDLIMYDRTTESLWQQATGEGIVGVHAGDQLTVLPASIISYADFRAAYPQGLVLSPQTGHSRSYGLNPYTGYDSTAIPFLFNSAELDQRFPAMLRVVGFVSGDQAIAYRYDLLAELGVIHDTFNGEDLVIFHQPGTASALDSRQISEGRDVGATAVFNPNLDGQRLVFSVQDGLILDEQTGSQWNIAGQAVAGELDGAQLERLVSVDHFWFAWAAFYPDTRVWSPE